MDFKDTPDQIVISLEHRRMQMIRRGPRSDKRNWAVERSGGRDGDSRVMDVMKMIDAFTTCLANFNRMFESHNTRT